MIFLQLAIQHVLKALDVTVAAIVIFATAATVVITCLGVFFRFVMNDALPWPEQVAGNLLVWITYGGSYVAARRSEHLGFDLIMTLIPERLRRRAEFAVRIGLIGFFATLFAFSLVMVAHHGDLMLQSIDIPEILFMVAIPVFAAGVFFQTLDELFTHGWSK